MKIGYIRVSRDDQNVVLQEDALEKEGCEKVYCDKMTGSRFDRPAFEEMLAYARPGDIIVVWKLDRLGRSLKHLLETVDALKARNIELRILTWNIDTSTPGGKLMFHLFAALAEFERDITIERTKAGLEAARARGRTGGRKSALDSIPASKLALAKQLYAAKEKKIEEILAITKLTRSTFYKYVVHGDDNKKEKGA